MSKDEDFKSSQPIEQVEEGDEDVAVPDNDELCELMYKLKLGKKELSRKTMLDAVHSEGPQWQSIKLDQVKRLWKKMVMKSPDQLSQGNGGSTSKQVSSKENQQPLNQSWKKLSRMKGPTVCNNNDDHGATSTPTAASESDQSHFPNQSRALAKQLNFLENNPGCDYVIFTPPSESTDQGIALSDSMGRIFFAILWNRCVLASWGSASIRKELWMVYQQLTGSLDERSKPILRSQLRAEFGVDPFEGKNNIDVESNPITSDELNHTLGQA